MTSDAMVTRGLTRSFGSRVAVADLNLRVQEGDIYGFLGPNGAGKTTAIRCILGLIRRDAGEVAIFGQTDPTAQRALVGALVETPAFHGWMSGQANLELAAAYAGVRDAGASIARALARVGLQGREREAVKGYSLGMRQRLGIARALLGDPKLLILDEPTNGLDPRGMREVRDLLRSLARQDRLTVFISSHLLGEVQQLCTRVGILEKGRLVYEGDPTGLEGQAEPEELTYELGTPDLKKLEAALAGRADVTLAGAGEAGRARLTLRGLTPSALVRLLVAADVPIDALVPIERSLEDLFLSKTSREIT